MSALDGWFEVCRAGEHTDSRGRRVTLTDDDMAGIAERFAAADPAPVVLGHPKTDDPAYGWVDRLRAVGGALQARVSKLDPAFRKWVNDGRYRGRSVALKGGPGHWSLRHLGFLGATPPAIDGLAPSAFAAACQFAEGDDVTCIEFAAEERAAWGGLATALAHLRDLLVDKFSIEDADRAMPRWVLRSVEDAAAEADTESTMAAEAAEPEGGQTMSGERDEAALAERESAVEAREAAFAAKEAELAERERRAEHREWVGEQVRAGRITPADAEPLAAFLAQAAPDTDAVITFADANGAEVSRPTLAWFREFVERAPLRVNYGETAPSHEHRAQQVRTAGNEQRSADGRKLGAAVTALMAANPTLTQDQALVLAKAEEESS